MLGAKRLPYSVRCAPSCVAAPAAELLELLDVLLQPRADRPGIGGSPLMTSSEAGPVLTALELFIKNVGGREADRGPLLERAEELKALLSGAEKRGASGADDVRACHSLALGALARAALVAGVQSKARVAGLLTLELGIELEGGSPDAAGPMVLVVASAAAEDSKWKVRTGGARVLGAYLRGAPGRRDALLSSPEGYWLSAMLVDDYCEVRSAAALALACSGTAGPASPGLPLSPPILAPARAVTVAVLAAAMGHACDAVEEAGGATSPLPAAALPAAAAAARVMRGLRTMRAVVAAASISTPAGATPGPRHEAEAQNTPPDLAALGGPRAAGGAGAALALPPMPDHGRIFLFPPLPPRLAVRALDAVAGMLAGRATGPPEAPPWAGEGAEAPPPGVTREESGEGRLVARAIGSHCCGCARGNSSSNCGSGGDGSGGGSSFRGHTGSSSPPLASTTASERDGGAGGKGGAVAVVAAATFLSEDAAGAIEAFCEACSLAGTPEGVETALRVFPRVHGGLLVLLEAVCPWPGPAVSGGGGGGEQEQEQEQEQEGGSRTPEPPSREGTRGQEEGGGGDGQGGRRSQVLALCPLHDTGSATIAAELRTPGSSGPLLDRLVAALSRAPQAYEAFAGAAFAGGEGLHGDNDDDGDGGGGAVAGAERRRRRHQGETLLLWLGATVQVLLRAATRLCQRATVAAAEAAPAGGLAREEVALLASRVPALLEAVLPFVQSATLADELVPAWGPAGQPPRAQALPPLPACQPPGSCLLSSSSLPSSSCSCSLTGNSGGGGGGGGGGGCTAEMLLSPVPWEDCPGPADLPCHALPAPWAGLPWTRRLASSCVAAACDLGAAAAAAAATGVLPRSAARQAPSAAPLSAAGEDVEEEEHRGSSGLPLYYSSAGGLEPLALELRAAARRRRQQQQQQHGGLSAGGGLDSTAGGDPGVHAAALVVRAARFPHVDGSALGHLLPLALPLADHHLPARRAVGLSLLGHLAAEAAPAALAWHRTLLLGVLEAAGRGASRDDPASSALALAALLRCLAAVPRAEAAEARRRGLALARDLVSQISRAPAAAGAGAGGALRLVCLRALAALAEDPRVSGGFALCDVLRPAFLCLLPLLQQPGFGGGGGSGGGGGFGAGRANDPRPATLRATLALCRACWPRVHAHAAKLLCAALFACADARRYLLALARAGDGGGRGRGGSGAGGGLGEAEEEACRRRAELVREYGERLGALVLVLSGETGNSVLEEACGAVEGLGPTAAGMRRLASRAGAGAGLAAAGAADAGTEEGDDGGGRSGGGGGSSSVAEPA